MTRGIRNAKQDLHLRQTLHVNQPKQNLVVACFYYQHLYTRFQTSSCSSIEQFCNCTSAFLSWIFLVQSGYEAASKVFILFLLNLPCWTTCPQVLYCFLSWTSCNVRLKMLPKFLYCVFSVFPAVFLGSFCFTFFCLLLPYSPVFRSRLQKFS